MSEHLSQDEMENYVKLKLPPAELLSADEHLRSCDQCLLMLGEALPAVHIDQALFDLEDGIPFQGHLSYQQFESYVDGTAIDAEREIVELHRETCPDCSQQLDELFQIRATLQLETASPATSLAGQREVSFWSKISASLLFRFGAPAFGAILIGAIAWAILLSDRRGSDVAVVLDPAVNARTVATNADTEALNSDIASVPDSNAVVTPPVISLADGPALIEIDGEGNVRGISAPQFEARIKAALTTQNIEISTAARELRSKSGVLMGDAQPGVPFALTSPVGKVIESARPQFRWKALDQAESYVVSVYDSNFNKVAESPPLKQNSWTSITLKRGNVYQWQVTARKEGEEIKSPARPAPDARFKVIDSIAANEINAAKRNFGNSRLVLGIAYANAGLLDDAEREFQALLKKNPNSEAVRRLLNKIRSAK